MERTYVDITFERKWFRVAGIAKQIRGFDPPPHWRFEVEGSPEQYPIHDFRFIGNATSENNRPGVNPRAEGEELVAWIAVYGNITTSENGHAEFKLLDPTTPCPWE